MNKLARSPATTVMIIHEDRLFRTGTATCSTAPAWVGYRWSRWSSHGTNPTRDFNNIVLRMKRLNPDIVIPANYYNEYALLVRHDEAAGRANPRRSSRCSAGRPRPTSS